MTYCEDHSGWHCRLEDICHLKMHNWCVWALSYHIEQPCKACIFCIFLVMEYKLPPLLAQRCIFHDSSK